jgi:hypothetical protein
MSERERDSVRNASSRAAHAVGFAAPRNPIRGIAATGCANPCSGAAMSAPAVARNFLREA